MRSLPKTVDPASIEQRWYAVWMERGYFRGDPHGSGAAFSIVMPPPNITGALHLGHALDNTLQDVLCRFKRMQGYDTLWIPGTDHAGIATQIVVERQLAAEGTNGRSCGRERFVERVWRWREESGRTITRQLMRLGVSCDWSRERFTMDEGLSRAVREVFVRLHEEGLIYRDRSLINWCPRCRTALSDLEVEHRETDGHLYGIRYPRADGAGAVTVATTRPETMLGDTAVAVHPDDERYRSLVGTEVILPILGRRIPIVADPVVEREFGTGAVKITPAHDFNDFALARRHGLPVIAVMDAAAAMTDQAGPYRGLDRGACRARLVEDLRREGLLERVVPHRHAIGHCQRCDTVVEPFLSPQWFVRVRPLAERAIAAVRNGESRFIPAHWERTYFAWMENIRDWCISRQLWWGHRIPAWYCEPCGTTVVAREDPSACDRCGGSLVQDPDVLDTWFSSALWPFSTMGWPAESDLLARFYPTSVLVTGFDIIFFWVARMLMMGCKFMGAVPFREVYIHALIRDEHGRKMSKSRGNIRDPLEILDTYGADALRFTLVALSAMGRDIRLSEERIAGYRNFVNKLWNAARFVQLQLAAESLDALRRPVEREALGPGERWVLSRLNRTVAATCSALEGYRFNEAAAELYRFVWHEYCDWYVELAKITLAGGGPAAAATRVVLVAVLERILRLLHPFIPFVTEELWQWVRECVGVAVRAPEGGLAAGVPQAESVMVAPFPVEEPGWTDAEAEARIGRLIGVVRAVRNLRAEVGLPAAAELTCILAAPGPVEGEIRSHDEWLRRLARLARVRYERGERPRGAATAVLDDVAIYVPLAGLVDLAAERRRLEREIGRQEAELRGVESKLAMPEFASRAPGEVVEKHMARAVRLREKIQTLRRGLQQVTEASR